MRASMETMGIGELLGLSIETLLISLCLKIMSILITVILYGRMIEIVRANAAPFAVAHRRNGNGRDAHGAINLNHTAIENDRDEDGHNLETQADQQRLYGISSLLPEP